MAQDLDRTAAKQHEDVMPLLGIDHVEYYVGNARQAAFYYSKAFGFHITAYAGPETGVRDRASYVVDQNNARYVFTGAMGPKLHIARHVFEHGDGVKDVALRVPNAEYAFDYATKQGAEGVLEPTAFEDDYGKIVRATIKRTDATGGIKWSRRFHYSVIAANGEKVGTSGETFTRDIGDDDPTAILIPSGLAHGYEALTDILFCYQVTREYDPADPDEHNVRWDDPRVAQLWSTREPILSARDAGAS